MLSGNLPRRRKIDEQGSVLTHLGSYLPIFAKHARFVIGSILGKRNQIMVLQSNEVV